MRDANATSHVRPTLAAVPGVSVRDRRRRGVAFAIAAFGVFPAGMAIDGLFSPSSAAHAILPVAAFVGYLFLGAKALAAGFPGLNGRWRSGRRRLILGIVAGAFLAHARPVRAQQTIFNVPTADVLDRGKLYFENDDLWRPWDPKFASFTIRGVVGLGSGVEAGANFGAFTTPGRSLPTVTLAVKWQPIRLGEFAVTAGTHGLFFLRGAEDGKPSAQAYAHVSYRLPTKTRITAGGWVASSGYAARAPVNGGLFGLEQPVAPHVALIADMYSGKSSIGYTSYGIEPTFGRWTIYAGYSVKNGNSKGNALLLEIGVNP